VTGLPLETGRERAYNGTEVESGEW
jgi:hypothetical protein